MMAQRSRRRSRSELVLSYLPSPSPDVALATPTLQASKKTGARPYLDRLSTCPHLADERTSLGRSAASWLTKLAIQPVPMPSLAHTGVRSVYQGPYTSFLRPDGSVSTALRSTIRGKMRSLPKQSAADLLDIRRIDLDRSMRRNVQARTESTVSTYAGAAAVEAFALDDDDDGDERGDDGHDGDDDHHGHDGGSGGGGRAGAPRRGEMSTTDPQMRGLGATSPPTDPQMRGLGATSPPDPRADPQMRGLGATSPPDPRADPQMRGLGATSPEGGRRRYGAGPPAAAAREPQFMSDDDETLATDVSVAPSDEASRASRRRRKKGSRGPNAAKAKAKTPFSNKTLFECMLDLEYGADGGLDDTGFNWNLSDDVCEAIGK